MRNNEFDFVEFLPWIHKIEDPEEEIKYIFSNFYPQFDYKKMKNYKLI